MGYEKKLEFMYIKEIEIDNFKSFANKVTIPFMEGFTTISGPNGSGKSNIIDSVLFALGLSSSRTLRAEKLFHLITTHNKRNEAIVKVTFADNGNNSAMTVTRKIKKSSQGFNSVYYLDGKVSTLSDIHNALMPYNISPNSYNVIMQGDVTGIINASPGERRKIVDEIAGVADFDRRIEQAMKELETVVERVERSNIILNETEKRLSQLEEERVQALKYQKYKDEKQDLEGKLSTVKYFEIKNSIERLHESILEGNKNKKTEEEKLKELVQSLDVLKQKYNEVQEAVRTKGEAEQIEIQKHSESLKGNIARKKDSIALATKQIGDNKTAIENSKSNIQTLKDKIDDAQLKIENKKDEIKILESNITREKEELDKVLAQVTGLNNSTNEQVEKRNTLRKQLEDTKDAENNLIKEKLPVEEKLKTYKRDVEEAKSIIENLESTQKNNDDSQDLIKQQIEQISKELGELEILQKNGLYELDKIKGEISDSNHDINLAYRKITNLEAQKQAFEDTNFGRAIDTVLRADLDGVHAPLAKLGKVDSKYSDAMEVAMGGRMSNIVVDDDEVASIAIQILKSSNAGRATFLPLNKMRSAPRNMKAPRERGVVDYAINLIDFDEKYRDAFYNAIGDTLVFEDLDSARRLTGKYRMVTLGGDIVEKSGSMTGGSMRRSGLKFGQNEDEQLNLFKVRLKEMEDKHNALECKRIDLEAKQDKIRTEYSAAMNDLNKKKMEYDNVVRNITVNKETLDSKSKLIEEYLPEINSMEKNLDELEQKHIVLLEQIQNLSSQIELVESQMPQDELSKLKELTESIETEIKRNETKIANCSNDIKGFNMEIGYHNEAIVAQEAQIQKLIKDNEILLQDKEKFQKDIEEIEVQLEELKKKIQEIGSKLVELQQERDKIQQDVINEEKRKSILEVKIERIQQQIEAFKAHRKELEPQLFEIKEELKNAGQDVSNLKPLDISVEEVLKTISRLDRKMEDLGAVNMRAITDYDNVMTSREELRTRIETLDTERNQIIERTKGYEELKKTSFLETFNNINENFVDIFNRLSDGEGRLILDKPEDPLNGGMTIEARPRDKKMQRLESMSGGEKSLTALAFVFAIQRYMPAPFYAFDEVDMHLDGINVEKLSEMIKYQSKDTQFIVVSLRKPMIESADRTVGVTQKDKGITKVTGVRFSD